MQLEKEKSIRTALSLATCALLNATAHAEAEFSILEDSEFSATNMLYSEDNRVTVDETLLSARKNLDDDEYLKITVTVDIMSGASPNGLPAINKPQEADTFTTPSGSIIKPNAGREQTYSFQDTRGALSLEWQKPLSRLLKTVMGTSLSVEQDYASIGLSSRWNRETEDRLTAFVTGFGFNYDIIDPVGGVPLALTPTSNGSRKPRESKTETDFLLGVTQVVSRNLLTQANYTLNYKQGYLTDPYKLVGFLDNDDLAPVNLDPYYHEKRPSRRLSHILYFNMLYNLDEAGDVVRFSYRYFQDSWAIDSHTLEMRFLKKLTETWEVQLKYRFYQQQAASFYHYYLVDGDYPGIESRDIVNNPQNLDYVSADYRLGNLRTDTVGIKLSRYFPDSDGRMDFRLARIINRDRKGRFETVRAWVLQVVGKILF